MRAGDGHLHGQRLILVALVVLAGCAQKDPFVPPAFVAPWECAGGGERCTQRYPELPDDGEWECAEVEGVAICRGAAGTRAESRWACGARRAAEGERVCVDAAPDVPSGGSWDCHYEHWPERRVCARAEEKKRQERQDRQGRTPDCWLDSDCGGASCRAGRCG